MVGTTQQQATGPKVAADTYARRILLAAFTREWPTITDWHFDTVMQQVLTPEGNLDYVLTQGRHKLHMINQTHFDEHIYLDFGPCGCIRQQRNRVPRRGDRVLVAWPRKPTQMWAYCNDALYNYLRVLKFGPDDSLANLWLKLFDPAGNGDLYMVLLLFGEFKDLDLLIQLQAGQLAPPRDEKVVSLALRHKMEPYGLVLPNGWTVDALMHTLCYRLDWPAWYRNFKARYQITTGQELEHNVQKCPVCYTGNDLRGKLKWS